MGRKRLYSSDAERQKAYRHRDRWIRVDERLPADGEWVLCPIPTTAPKRLALNPPIFVCKWDTKARMFCPDSWDDGVPVDGVTHWRALPEPPKEDA